MNVLEFNPHWKNDIAFCFVDNTSKYQSTTRELIKNQADGTLANVYNKGWTVYQWTDEDELLRHASNQDHKWAVVFSTGTEFINGDRFFEALHELVKQDFFIAGHILDRKDAYYEIHHQCYVINLQKYKKLSCPQVGKQALGIRHVQTLPCRSVQTYHDDYTPVAVSSGNIVQEFNHKCHGWNILSCAFEAGEHVLVFGADIRDNKIHFYPESPQDFNKILGWAYHRSTYCQKEFVHTGHTEITDLPIKLYDQIVTPASGVWFSNYVSENATVTFYDYNQASLDYWKQHAPTIMNVSYTYVLCDLLGTDTLADHILPTTNTLVHLSNIFNYEGTNFFYSLPYRSYKETQLLTEIKEVCPTAEVYFNLRANIFDTVPTWHINS